jgi:hypothetical protein
MAVRCRSTVYSGGASAWGYGRRWSSSTSRTRRRAKVGGTVVNLAFSAVVVNTPTAADNGCGGGPGQILIQTDVATTYLTVTVTDDSSTTSLGGELATGQLINAYGRCESGLALRATQIVIIDDQRSP